MPQVSAPRTSNALSAPLRFFSDSLPHLLRRAPRATLLAPQAPLALLLLAAMALLTAAGCATTRGPGERVDDSALTARVKAKLTADPQVNPFEIDVDVREGVVRLSGTVGSDEARREALQLARDTSGVRDVVDDLQVGPKTTQESFSDAWINARVKAKLTADPEVNPFTIDVDTERGVVTLTGEVSSESARREAIRLAADTKGVVDVRDRLEVVR